MSVSITSRNPIKYTVTEGGSGTYALSVSDVIDFTYSPVDAVFTQQVTDTASNDSSLNPDQGLFSSNIETYANGAGKIGYTLAVPESTKFQDPNGINITYDLKIIESTRTQYNIASADVIINVQIQPYPAVFKLTAGQTMVVSGPVAPGTTYEFPAQGQATLEIEDPSNFQGTIEGFDEGDEIDFDGTTIYDAVEVGSNLEVITSESGSESPLIFPVFMPPYDIVAFSSDGHGGDKATASPKGGGLTAKINVSGNKDATGKTLLDSSQLQLIENAIDAALSQYGKVIGGRAAFNVLLKIDQQDFVASTSLFVPTGKTDPTTKNQIYQTAAQWMLKNPGKDPWSVKGTYVKPGAATDFQPVQNGVPQPDFVIYINSDLIKKIDLNDDAEVPSDKTYLISNLIMHELGHVFGIVSFRDASGKLNVSGKETVLDSYISQGEKTAFDDPGYFFKTPSTKLGVVFGADGVHLGTDGWLPELMSPGDQSYLAGQGKLGVSENSKKILKDLDPDIYGEILIPAGSTFELSTQEQAFAAENVGFVSGIGAGASTLKLDIPLTGTIGGFAPGDMIDVAYVTPANFGSAAKNLNLVWATSSLSIGGTLSLIDPAQPSNPLASLSLNGSYSASQFVVLNDGQSHPLIAWAPALTVSNGLTATRAQVLSLSALLWISDPDQVGYIKLELWDSNGTVTGGQFKINGVAQTGGHEIDITPANVANMVFDAGAAAGSDTLWARLLQADGSLTPWQQFTVNVPTPALSVTSIGSASKGQVINLSSLVSIADPGNIGYQKLELWDSNGTAAGGQFKVSGVALTGGHEIDVLELWDANGTVAGGQFKVSGVAQTGGHEIDITPANVANTVFDAGTVGGTDTLWARLQQADGSLTPWQPFSVTVPAPTLSVASIGNAGKGQVINLSSLVSIFDPSNVGYQKLELWDSNGTAAGGQFKINGVAQTGGHEIDVTPANVANAMFDAGTVAGTDTLWARLQQADGSLTAWTPFSVSVPAPTITVSNYSGATPNQVINLSSLVTISDTAAVGYQQLQLWDSNGTAATGQFKVNGVAQTGGHEIDVTPANVAKTVFDVGTTGATDALWARLLQNDGTLTPWQQFIVKDPLTVSAGGTLDLDFAYAGTVNFIGPTGTLQLDDSSSFSGTIAGMTGADSLDLRDINPAAVQLPSYSGTAAGGTLTLTDSTHSANIALLGNYLASTFVTSNDGHGGTLVTAVAEGSNTPLVTPPHA